MKRRAFLKLTSGAAITAGSILPGFQQPRAEADVEQKPASDTHEFHVSPAGNDRNPGTESLPFATLSRAQLAVRHAKRNGPIHVWIGKGSYHLTAPLTSDPRIQERPKRQSSTQLDPGKRHFSAGVVCLFANGRRTKTAS
jgi:hypothetical protein